MNTVSGAGLTLSGGLERVSGDLAVTRVREVDPEERVLEDVAANGAILTLVDQDAGTVFRERDACIPDREPFDGDGIRRHANKAPLAVPIEDGACLSDERDRLVQLQGRLDVRASCYTYGVSPTGCSERRRDRGVLAARTHMECSGLSLKG